MHVAERRPAYVACVVETDAKQSPAKLAIACNAFSQLRFIRSLHSESPSGMHDRGAVKGCSSSEGPSRLEGAEDLSLLPANYTLNET